MAGTLREPCPRPPIPDRPTVGDLAGFSIRQEAALSVCDARREAAVTVIDAVNKLLTQLSQAPKRRFWPF